jgi:hypothetical protein
MTKAKPLPSQEKLLCLFDYDNKSGLLIWKHKKHSTSSGKIAGYKSRGYIKIQIDGLEFMAHRIIWKIVTKFDPSHMQVDHINGNKSDNRFLNLRLASNAENAMNRSISARNTTGYKGVSYSNHRKKWVATIRIDGKSIYLGGYQTAEIAHMAYCKAAKELHGDFARVL